MAIDGQGGSGDSYDIGGKLKEAGTDHWGEEICDNGETPTAICNSSGFTARPGGYMDSTNNTFRYSGLLTYFWSSSDSNLGAWFRFLYSGNSNVVRNGNGKNYGFSVRCVRD